MGKVLGSILTIAAAVAVNFIPGVGPWLSTAIGQTLAGAGIYATTAATITAGLVAGLSAAVTIAGLQSAAGLLGLGPSISKPQTTETAIKTPRPERVSAYGRARSFASWGLA